MDAMPGLLPPLHSVLAPSPRNDLGCAFSAQLTQSRHPSQIRPEVCLRGDSRSVKLSVNHILTPPPEVGTNDLPKLPSESVVGKPKAPWPVQFCAKKGPQPHGVL